MDQSGPVSDDGSFGDASAPGAVPIDAPPPADRYLVFEPRGHQPVDGAQPTEYHMYALLPHQEPHEVLMPLVEPSLWHFFRRTNCAKKRRCSESVLCRPCIGHRFQTACAVCERTPPHVGMCNSGCGHVFCFECVARHLEWARTDGPADGFGESGQLAVVRCPVQRCRTPMRFLMRCMVVEADEDVVKIKSLGSGGVAEEDSDDDTDDDYDPNRVPRYVRRHSI